MNRIDARPRAGRHFGLLSRHDEDVFICRRVLVDVRDLLVNVTFYTTAERRIELSQIADFQRIADFRLPIADLRDAAMIATNSLASLSKGSTCVFPRILESVISSSQHAVSSASSSSAPILAMNSARDRARQAAR